MIHGAGVIEDKLLRDKTPESFDRVFGTKVDSSLLLARKLGALAGRILLPRAVKHPVQELSGKTASAASDARKETRGLLKKRGKSLTDAAPANKLSKKAKKRLKGNRKGLGRLT